MATVTVESTHDLQQRITAGAHEFLADEPIGAGGNDAGPNPYEYLLAALGACTSMTLLIYAKRKGIALEKVKVTLGHSRVHAADCVDCETKDGFVTELQRDIELTGALSDAQRQRLMEIAAMCPVHRTLTAEIKIRDRMV